MSVPRCTLAGCLFAGLLVFGGGPISWSADQAQPSAGKPAAGDAAEPSRSAAPDRYALPGDNVAALVKHLDELQQFRPGNAEEAIAYRQQASVALKAAAEKLLELAPDPKSAPHRKAQGVLFQLQARNIGRLPPEEQRRLVAQVRAYLDGQEPTREDLGLAMLLANGLEEGGAEGLALEAYQAFSTVFAAHRDPRFVAFGQLFAGSARRLQLVGQPLELAGTTLDGTKFELSELKGKVVLVDFWASWCGPCRAETPEVRRVYDRYHRQGFEVVGISLDRERQALERYLAEEHLPWITLHEREPGGENTVTRRYGICGIPSMFLVGRDGKVLSTHARGDELTRLLAEQFRDPSAADKAGG